VGVIAAEVGIPLVQLVPHQASLEEAFMQITRESVEFVGAVR
jgi:ABC-2 type transport system ATP-binding protein